MAVIVVMVLAVVVEAEVGLGVEVWLDVEEEFGVGSGVRVGVGSGSRVGVELVGPNIAPPVCAIVRAVACALSVRVCLHVYPHMRVREHDVCICP